MGGVSSCECSLPTMRVLSLGGQCHCGPTDTPIPVFSCGCLLLPSPAMHVAPTVALVLATCAIVLTHVMRQARQLRYSLKDCPATVPELLLATVKAVAYG
jgi:hypothetical protein